MINRTKFPPITEANKAEWIEYLTQQANFITDNQSSIEDNTEYNNRIFGAQDDDTGEVLSILVSVLQTLEQNTLTPKV